jgi:RNA polymerase sigma-70 factor (ECF subfamily)
MTSLIERLQRRRIRRALTRLTRLQYEVFMFCRADDLTYDEIAAKLAITPREVEHQLAAALTGLRRAMEADAVGRLTNLLRSRAAKATRSRKCGVGKRRE